MCKNAGNVIVEMVWKSIWKKNKKKVYKLLVIKEKVVSLHSEKS